MRLDSARECLPIHEHMGGASILDRSIPRLRSVSDRPGTQVSDVASFVLVPGDSVAVAVMDKPGGRTALHRGRVVADQLELV